MRDLERYARNIRNENRTSISVGTGEPKQHEGNDGDIRINSTTGGVKLYTKYKAEWYSVGLTKLLNVPKKISTIGIPTIISEHPTSGAALGMPQGDNAISTSEMKGKGGIQPRDSVIHVEDTTTNDDGVTSYESFENDIATLAAKINEIIESIQ